ncbi:glycoside hydrolase family 13 protein [Pseudonocardia acaciae]|uniref:glycoside hydrolase family 13 protein n=1 Tax=Pseudonocardia acaciae TaxID=551276 RepID=UPI0004912B9E|nr:glycoside hydrolase family 13 protein [Pseudonocardia acaciae]
MQPSQHPAPGVERPWWHDAVCYQVYLRSFADSNGDGVGDLDGVRSRLGYLELLGVDALWLTPCYPSPMVDGGYDVADPRNIDPLFGDLAAFDTLVAASHEHGIRLILDLVPNHTSDQHEWFQTALNSAPGSPERDRYLFRYGLGDDGATPPNNWPSQFGGPGWTRVTEPHGQLGQWYMHLFAPEQPDLNWSNPDVWADLEKTLRFWLDRGVDGFRIDVAHGMAKPHGLPNAEPHQFGLADGGRGPDIRFDLDGVHEVHRMIRSVVNEYPGRALVGEIWVGDDERFGRYLRPDELHLGFNFRLTTAPFDADTIREAIEHSMAAVVTVGGTPTWTLSNHDVPRPVTRFGGGEVGVRRARALALVELALPGAVFLYNGEELGLPSVELPDSALRDPVWEHSGHTRRGRDGHRVPIPWEGYEPNYGFTDGDETWLPMPDDWSSLTVEAQLEDASSTLSLYRHALEIRRTHPGFVGDELEWYGAPEGCFAYRRPGTTLVCALNTSPVPVPLPPGDPLISSAPLTDNGELPPDTAVWLA